NLIVEPHAVQERLPLWLGGHTPVSLRRALKYGDGWVPFGLPHDKLREMLDGADVPDDFELVLGAGRPMRPVEDPDQARRALTRTKDAGATIANVHLAADSAAHYVEQLEALAAIAKEI